jgi:hypothetical protein
MALSVAIEASEDANNSQVLDTPTSQKLSQEEIEKLKEASLSGQLDHGVCICVLKVVKALGIKESV